MSVPMPELERQRCCGIPVDCGHRASCLNAIEGDPEPWGRDADESDLDDAGDRLVAAITGEPRES